MRSIRNFVIASLLVLFAQPILAQPAITLEAFGGWLWTSKAGYNSNIVVDDKGNTPFTTLPGGRKSYAISLNRGDKHGEWVRFGDSEYYLDISVTPLVNGKENK